MLESITDRREKQNVSQSWDPSVLAAADDLEWISRVLVEGFLQGLHRSPLRGFSSEFAEYKPYTQGEDLRFLDWQALARLDRPYIRQFEAETNLRAMILLDCSGSMNYAGENSRLTKFRYATMLCAALLRLMMRQNDACGLALIGAGGVEHLMPPGLGQHHFYKALALLDKAEPGGEADLSPHLLQCTHALRRRSQVILLTDAMEDLEPLRDQLKLLHSGRHEVMLWQILDPREVDFDFESTQYFQDLETEFRLPINPKYMRDNYLSAFHEHQERLREICLQLNIFHEPLRTDRSPGQALAETLARRESRL